MAATLQRSTGVTLSSTLKEHTTRHLFHVGDATIITPGASGFDVVRLKNSTLDTAYAAATTQAPIKHPPDYIRFAPVTFPETY